MSSIGHGASGRPLLAALAACRAAFRRHLIFIENSGASLILGTVDLVGDVDSLNFELYIDFTVTNQGELCLAYVIEYRSGQWKIIRNLSRRAEHGYGYETVAELPDYESASEADIVERSVTFAEESIKLWSPHLSFL
jgi:hypothetical protein